MQKWIIATYVVMSILAFAIYGIDKQQSRRHGRRISERTLHMLSVLGGWPGALVAQHLFRHKRSKPGFIIVFWFIVVLHLVIWGLVVATR